jgi:phosphatidylserine/phosphatidylglycerophosphate/cardiolipin synthase-like enzyme/uncharacterized membrane protein YdjX (TVP38/TMEM64 family)
VPDAAADTTDQILVEGRTCWRVARAGRLAFLVDAAAYFATVRRAILAAREQVLIVGWDLDSRVVLDPDAPEDEPRTLREVLSEAVRRRPGLRIHVLVWDYSLIFALEREAFIALALDQGTPPEVRFAFDDSVPATSSHHQKIVVIDDALAFTGSTDLTDHRWDTSDHDPDDPRRKRTNGTPYCPYHEVQAALDGEAAAALGELARTRWRRATGEELPAPDPRSAPWPDHVMPHLVEVDVGISRTEPAWAGRPEVREVEALHVAAISSARRSIYIENQYLSSDLIAHALSRRLADAHGPELVIVAPAACTGWLEQQTMDVARGRFLARLKEGDRHGRLRVFHPVVGGERRVPVMVHAKVLIVDDRLARIGSSNLSNRSMGFDTECDIAVEAGAHPDGSHVREAIATLRRRLLAEHLGADPAHLAAHEARTGSLIAAIEALPPSDRGLAPLEVAASATPLGEAVAKIADPESVDSAGIGVGLGHLIDRAFPQSVEIAGTRLGRRALVWIAVLVAVGIGLAGAWEWGPLAAVLEPAEVARQLVRLGTHEWAVPALLAAFVIGSITFFPITVLILAAALVFPAGEALFVASAGSMAGAGFGYGIGRMMGAPMVRRLLGRRARSAVRALVGRGIVPMLTLRILPLAPFTLVNVLAGAFHVRLRDYVAGTILGMAPGIVAATVLGRAATQLWNEPGPMSWLLTAGLLVVWLGLGAGLQWLLDRFAPNRGRGRRARRAT